MGPLQQLTDILRAGGQHVPDRDRDQTEAIAGALHHQMRFRWLVSAEPSPRLQRRRKRCERVIVIATVALPKNGSAGAGLNVCCLPIGIGQPSRLQLSLCIGHRPCMIEQERLRQVGMTAGETLPDIEQCLCALGLVKE
ncbi:hypothetical protein [Bradyrhizobium australiense]|uniref:Uncharacterized protein n=1 Tax=Bradyrhizobium australiense TaxID=2721161 RepID=A0A7Y4GNT7_9BRAD|nr:hypothetical protein [Bradyrhizobium australiense]NOJ39086.1 hypothetical protein [Bradyrhizobium australiense]